VNSLDNTSHSQYEPKEPREKVPAFITRAHANPHRRERSLELVRKNEALTPKVALQLELVDHRNVETG
jgi:hypothetical protein